MYTLYAIPGTCSTGIHILLNVLEQEFNIITKDKVDDFDAINPVGAVPVLDDNGTLIREGAAIVLYLLEKHQHPMLPTEPLAKAAFLQKLLFNYATMHPAYGRLFFAMNNLSGNAQTESYTTAAQAISQLWKVIDDQLAESRFVSGDAATIVDYLLCIYANWGTFINIDITLGDNVKRMIKEVTQLPEFANTFKAEGLEYGL